MINLSRIPILVTVLCLTLSACGGGGGDSGSAAGTASPPASAPSTPVAPVSPVSASVAFTGGPIAISGNTTTDATPHDATTRFLVSDIPSGGVWARVTRTGAGLRTASVVWEGSGRGLVDLQFFKPGQLGAGTYAATVNVEVCSDNACAQQIGGSPFTFAVTYVVTGSVQPTTRVQWSDNSTYTEKFYPVSQTTSPTVELRVQVLDLPTNGLYFGLRRSSDGLITRATLSEPTFSTNDAAAVSGTFTVTLKQPAALGSGAFQGTLTVLACFDDACTQIVPGTEYSMGVTVVVHAVEGVHFARREIKPENGATDVTWSPVTNSLYATAGFYNASGGEVLQVDPHGGTTTRSASAAGEKPDRLRVSADGTRLFVSSASHARVQRFALPALTAETTFTFDASILPPVVGDLATLPGQPLAILTTLSKNFQDAGVTAFDDGVARSSVVAPDTTRLQRNRSLTPGASPGTFYSARTNPLPPYAGSIEKLVVDAGGVSVAQSFPTTTLVESVQYAAGRLFASDGTVFDAATGAVVGTLSLPLRWGRLETYADPAHGRVYVRATNDYLLCFDATTLKLISIAPLGWSSQRPTFMPGTRGAFWGNDGLALVDGTTLLVLNGSFFSTYDGKPTMSSDVLSPIF